MSSHDRSDNRTPATYRTTRPDTYRTTNPATTAAPSVHRTAGRYGALPCVAAPAPATPRHTPPKATPATDASDDRSAEPTQPWSAGTRRAARAHYVDSDCLIGVRDPRRPGLLQARSVDTGGHPQVMLPVLRRLWSAAGRDSIRLAALLLACDWRYLDPAIPTITPMSPTADTALPARDEHADNSTLPGVAGRRIIAGLGISRTATGPDIVNDGERATVVPLAHLGLLDAAWLYLLEPADDSVAIHTGEGGLVSRHLLTA